MKRVYQAANHIQAHMVMHVLEQAGVHAHVQGEFLQSGAGELPIGNSSASRSRTRTSRSRARSSTSGRS